MERQREDETRLRWGNGVYTVQNSIGPSSKVCAEVVHITYSVSTRRPQGRSPRLHLVLLVLS